MSEGYSGEKINNLFTKDTTQMPYRDQGFRIRKDAMYDILKGSHQKN